MRVLLLLAVLACSWAATAAEMHDVEQSTLNDEIATEKGRELSGGYSWVAPGDFQPTLATRISLSTQLGSAYICSGTMNGNTYPGTYLYEKNKCIITYLGKAIPAQNPILVLQAKFTMKRYNWMGPHTFLQAPAVIGGRENGKPQFICMAKDAASGAKVIGVFTVDLHYCHYPSNGTDFEAFNFKILKKVKIANPL